MATAPGTRSLSFLSFNVQAGAGTCAPHAYLTQSWRHVLPSKSNRANMRSIARLIRSHDIIGLQEIDAGSWRTQDRNQIRFLAERAGLCFWHAQVNRNLGRLAQHGLGLISRYPPDAVDEYDLPGRIPGRGALVARFGTQGAQLCVVVTHLSLGEGSRTQQLEAIGGVIADARYTVILADTNCASRALAAHPTFIRLGLRTTNPALPTYPSWRPRRDIDHVISSSTLKTHRARVANVAFSDHRPVYQRIDWPASVRLNPPFSPSRAGPARKSA